MAALFNLTRAQPRREQKVRISSGGEVSGYTLDDKGNIDFPVLGTLHIAGMTKSQISALVKQKLIDENLVKDPVVTVEFMNLYFSVLGEVKSPGKYSITKDQITLLEAISMAGDLSIYGKRDAVFVIREENGERVTHWADLRSKDVFNSPVYYLKQNDVIYVQPNQGACRTVYSEREQCEVMFRCGLPLFLSSTSLGVLYQVTFTFPNIITYMREKKLPRQACRIDFQTVQDLWGLFVPKWHWFVLSLFVTMSVAVLRLDEHSFHLYPQCGNFGKRRF